MDEIKTAKCIGVMEITRINVACPHCSLGLEMPYEEFVKKIGVPWLGEHEGYEMTCQYCNGRFPLGEFEVQE